jgi:ubiquinone/menaquinone biosynthesis C-methylase UbiE
MSNPANAPVGYRDLLYKMEAFTAFKHQTFALLGVQEGYHILDIGCGIGADVRLLAQKVGQTGRVVGIDKSETMITQAQERAQGSNLPLEYHIGDAHSLPFPDNSFDACRSDLTFQHLENPETALAEVIRVARSGASIVIAEPDGETEIIDMPDQALTRKILNYHSDLRRNGWMGRQLPRLFKQAGLVDVRIFPETFVQTDYALADRLFRLRATVQRAEQSGVITGEEGVRWLTYLEEMSKAGSFFCGGTIFTVSGKKP